MDLLREFFGVGAEDDTAATQTKPAAGTADMTDEERQQARPHGPGGAEPVQEQPVVARAAAEEGQPAAPDLRRRHGR